MPHLHYRVVPHDGGWAYTLDGAFSEPFESRDRALQAAHQAAAEQSIPTDTVLIEYQDATDTWHTELSRGEDRADADVIE